MAAATMTLERSPISLAAYGLWGHIQEHKDSDDHYSWTLEETAEEFGLTENKTRRIFDELITKGFVVIRERRKP